MSTSAKTITITGEYITLGQLLKKLHLIQTGGEEKIFLSETIILVNGEREERRGRKIRHNDAVTIEGTTYKICSSNG